MSQRHATRSTVSQLIDEPVFSGVRAQRDGVFLDELDEVRGMHRISSDSRTVW